MTFESWTTRSVLGLCTCEHIRWPNLMRSVTQNTRFCQFHLFAGLFAPGCLLLNITAPQPSAVKDVKSVTRAWTKLWTNRVISQFYCCWAQFGKWRCSPVCGNVSLCAHCIVGDLTLCCHHVSQLTRLALMCFKWNLPIVSWYYSHTELQIISVVCVCVCVRVCVCVCVSQ